MIIRDVNNYIAEYEDSTEDNEHLKLKGCFEIDKEFHKDPSMKIVPIALYEYFINGVPIEQTIKTHKNIYDFCLRLKINHSSSAFYSYLENNQIAKLELGRTTRYFVSKTGGGLTVYYNGSKNMTRLNKEYQFTLFNKFYKSFRPTHYKYNLPYPPSTPRNSRIPRCQVNHMPNRSHNSLLSKSHLSRMLLFLRRKILM